MQTVLVIRTRAIRDLLKQTLTYTSVFEKQLYTQAPIFICISIEILYIYCTALHNPLYIYTSQSLAWVFGISGSNNIILIWITAS